MAAGRGSSCTQRREASGPSVKPGAARLPVLTRINEEVLIELTGGAGNGSPLERDPEAVLTDLLGGYISQDQVMERYGVVIGAGQVDMEATRRLRHERGVHQK